MTATLSKEIELAGVYVEVEVQYDVRYVDNGFDHAFGTEHIWEWEVQDVEDFYILTDLKDAVSECLADLGRVNRNRAWKKQRRQWVRKIEAAFAKVDDSDLWDNRDVQAAASEQYDPPEPDWDDELERRRERVYDGP